MVKKLLSQRQRLGDIRPQHHRCGCKPLFDAGCCRRLQNLVAARPNATLQELREALGVACTLVAIHYVLIRLGLTSRLSGFNYHSHSWLGLWVSIKLSGVSVSS